MIEQRLGEPAERDRSPLLDPGDLERARRIVHDRVPEPDGERLPEQVLPPVERQRPWLTARDLAVLSRRSAPSRS